MNTQAQRALIKDSRHMEASIAVAIIAAVCAVLLLWSMADWPPRAMTDPHSTSRVQ